ncbi:hypothetical protein SAMN04489858_1093 [Paracoccus homiensis]|uniref:Uncharacterized protein n=1 Tax=Paracoccus homiensis TaxID=364199 RepID=A0A1I0GP51_9RHOB|nr:hypothetical protein SAMN04489858_1093 [Paracoccus homiensis]
MQTSTCAAQGSRPRGTRNHKRSFTPLYRPNENLLMLQKERASDKCTIGRQYQVLNGEAQNSAGARDYAGQDISFKGQPAIWSVAFQGQGLGGECQAGHGELATGMQADLAVPSSFAPEHHARAHKVAEFLRNHDAWDRGEYVTQTIDGSEFVVIDIGMRILAPRELFRAHGSPDNYVIGGPRHLRSGLAPVPEGCAGQLLQQQRLHDAGRGYRGRSLRAPCSRARMTPTATTLIARSGEPRRHQ